MRHIAVVIPARNEERLLRRCLLSVAAARAALPSHVTSDLVLAVDCSIDQTSAIAQREIRHTGVIIDTSAGAVGIVRSLATRVALSRYQGPPEHCWIANTDADSIVPENWLTDQLLFAKTGIDAVAGIIDVDSFEDHKPFVRERFRATYLLGSDGTHSHVHGANIGFRADIYLRAGGWGRLVTGEDHDLWRRLSAAGARTVSPSTLCVMTSGRRSARAPHGFAEALAAHNESAHG